MAKQVSDTWHQVWSGHFGMQVLLKVLCLRVCISVFSLMAGTCIELKNEIQEGLLHALESADFAYLNGSVSLTRVGIDDEFDCTRTACLFSNPTSAYSFSFLPLSQEEDLDKKLGDSLDLPVWSKTALNGSEGWDFGVSPIWQLRHDEVVLLFGCTPPAQSSRYFGITPYMHGTYFEGSKKWSALLGSLGDSKGVVRAANGMFGYQNRLKTAAGQPDDVDLTSDGADLESAFEKLTVVVFGASRASVENARSTADKVLVEHGVQNAVDVLPISQDFGPVGLADETNSHFSYFSLLLRNILDGAAIPVYEEYVRTSPFSVWRLTPKWATQPSKEDQFGEAEVVPRAPAAGMSTSEAHLSEGLEILISKVEEAFNEDYVVAHSLVTQSVWDSLGVDFGKSCVDKESAVCYYDNRDVMFLTVFPLLRLNTQEKFTYMVGVNHRVAGTVMYSSVALNRVENQIGVAGSDDIDMYGSAESFLKGTKFEHLHTSFFALRFARDCANVPFCTTIPTEGDRGAAFNQTMVLLERLYVNPETGVRPSDTNVLPGHTLTFTPRAMSSESDMRNRVSKEITETSPCFTSWTGISTCQTEINRVCCAAVGQFIAGGCLCSDLGKSVLEASGVPVGSINALAVFCSIMPTPC